MTELSGMMKDVEKVLLENYNTFRWYEELHRAKPDHEKADRNKEFKERTEQALSKIQKLRESVPFMTPTPKGWQGDMRSVCNPENAYKSAELLKDIMEKDDVPDTGEISTSGYVDDR